MRFQAFRFEPSVNTCKTSTKEVRSAYERFPVDPRDVRKHARSNCTFEIVVRGQELRVRLRRAVNRAKTCKRYEPRNRCRYRCTIFFFFCRDRCNVSCGKNDGAHKCLISRPLRKHHRATEPRLPAAPAFQRRRAIRPGVFRRPRANDDHPATAICVS